MTIPIAVPFNQKQSFKYVRDRPFPAPPPECPGKACSQAKGIRYPSNNWNLECGNPESITWNLESTAWNNPESKDCFGLPLMGRIVCSFLCFVSIFRTQRTVRNGELSSELLTVKVLRILFLLYQKRPWLFKGLIALSTG